MNDESSDILIVGAGLAGFTAALRASEQGAQVLLIDKSHGALGDGNVLMASGSLRAGGKSPKTNSRELYDFVISEGVWYHDLVKAWSETCGRAIDWLISVGVSIEETAPGRIWLDQTSETCLVPVYKKDVGARALTSLKDRLLKLGGRYLGDGSTSCAHDAAGDCVPTVSEWGLAVMALLVLTAATVVIMRRRAVVAT